jgi:hypothetical protein
MGTGATAYDRYPDRPNLRLAGPTGAEAMVRKDVRYRIIITSIRSLED